MKNLQEMLANTVRYNGSATAVVDGDFSVSYLDLDRRIGCVAARLRELGVRPGDRVSLLLPNDLHFVTSYFAVVSVGGIVVPLNDHYQQNELLYFLDECGVSVLITSRDYTTLCNDVLPLCRSQKQLLFAEEVPIDLDEERARADRFQADPGSKVMYQFSSGSTGRPKRIARTHANLVFELDSFVQTLGITSRDRFLGVAPFSHVNGLMRSMMTSVRAGACLYPMARFERRAVAETIVKHRISVFIAVPVMFSTLAKTNFHQQPDFSSLRLCVSASAPMPRKLNQAFHEAFGIYVRQLYGSTETGTISVNLSPGIDGTLDSVGTPITGVEVDVLREDGQRAAIGEVGEFAVRSPAAIRAYEGLDDVNRETFRNGYFFTGDLGRKDGDGLLYLAGRKKFFINKGGYKIDPREIEELLEGHPLVDETAVFGLPTAYGDEKITAVVVANGPCTAEELINFCRGKIADFKIPSVVQFRDSLPKSSTGKIRRAMLYES